MIITHCEELVIDNFSWITSLAECTHANNRRRRVKYHFFHSNRVLISCEHSRFPILCRPLAINIVVLFWTKPHASVPHCTTICCKIVAMWYTCRLHLNFNFKIQETQPTSWLDAAPLHDLLHSIDTPIIVVPRARIFFSSCRRTAVVHALQRTLHRRLHTGYFNFGVQVGYHNTLNGDITCCNTQRTLL